jgi:hypothetical protein
MDLALRRQVRHRLLDPRRHLTPVMALLLSIVPLVPGLHHPRPPNVERSAPIVAGGTLSSMCPCFRTDSPWRAAMETRIL